MATWSDDYRWSSYESEVRTYLAAAGGGFRLATIRALNKFVRTGKQSGWWPKLAEVYPFCGPSLTASLVKLKYALGSPSSLINNGMLDANYSELAGMGNVQAGTPPARFLQTGVSLASLGLSATNLVFGGFMFNQSSGSNGFIIGDTSPSGDSGIAMGPSSFGPLVGAGAYTSGLGMGGYLWVCDVGKNFIYHTGVVQNRNPTSAAFTSVGEIVIFKRNLASPGPQYFASGKAGMFVIGTGAGMTEAQASSLSRAIYDFNLAVRTLIGPGTQSPPDLYFGDSITSGYYSNPISSGWAGQLSLARNRACLNFGLPTSATDFDITGVPGLSSRFTAAALNFPASRVNFMIGTNNAQQDSTTNGDATKIASYVTNFTTLLQTAAARWGASNIYVISPPWRYGDKNSTYNAAWNAGMAAAVAAVPGVTFKDVYTAFIAQPTPSSLMQDNVHWNTAGHTFAAVQAA